MEHISLTDIIREAFDKKPTWTLKYLFALVQENKNYSQFNPTQIKYKIHRCIFNLQEKKEIEKIGTSIYKKI